MIETLLKSLNGRFFTVVFTKKDGTVRQMNCRTGVKKHLRGGAKKSSGFIAFDLKARGYRTINLDTVKEIRADKKVIKIS